MDIVDARKLHTVCAGTIGSGDTFIDNNGDLCMAIVERNDYKAINLTKGKFADVDYEDMVVPVRCEVKIVAVLVN